MRVEGEVEGSEKIDKGNTWKVRRRT